MSGMIWGRSPSGTAVKIQVTDAGAVVVSGAVGGGGSGGTSDTLESTQQLVKTAVQNIDTDLGAAADAAAATDTGASSIISLLKRGLQRWTTLLDRIPALVAGRVPVDGSGVTQPVSAAALGAPADARAAWYDSAASLVSVLKLAVAAFVGAGSRSYVYTNGVLTSESWTLFGTTRTKTYTYTGGALTAESDWV